MNPVRIVGIVLIVAGVLGLALGNFSWTRETQAAKLGPIELTVRERKAVNVPIWAGFGAILVGGALLLYGSRKQ